MQRREKLLVIALVGAMVAWRGWPIANRLLFGSLEARKLELQTVTMELQQKEAEQLKVIRATSKMREWRDTSLPADELDAHRFYQQWLTDLAQSCGWTRPKVVPGRKSAKGSVYTALQVDVEGVATYEQIVSFLFHFHRMNLLHRVVQVDITKPPRGGTELLEVKLIAEGLSLREGPQRKSLLPQTTLAQDVPRSETTWTVNEGDLFPAPPFRVKIGREHAMVTKVDKTQWTVSRGVDGTSAADHSAGGLVQLDPINPALAKMTLDEYQQALGTSLFRPHQNLAPRIAEIRSQNAYYDRPLTFQVRATDPDGSEDELTYSLRGDRLPGARIDERTGEFTWTPGGSLEAGEYTVEITVRDSGAPRQSASRRVTINLHEDPAKYTYYTTFTEWNGRPQAWLRDPEANRQIVLEEGEAFSVADLEGRVVKITRNHLILETSDGRQHELEIGGNLRAMKVISSSETPKAADQQASGEAEEPKVDSDSPAAGDDTPDSDADEQA